MGRYRFLSAGYIYISKGLVCWIKGNCCKEKLATHYNDVTMSAMASQINGFSVVCSTVGSGADQTNHQNSTSLAFVRRIHRWPVNSLHKGPATRKMFPFDDVIMSQICVPVIVITLHQLSICKIWGLISDNHCSLSYRFMVTSISKNVSIWLWYYT